MERCQICVLKKSVEIFNNLYDDNFLQNAEFTIPSFEKYYKRGVSNIKLNADRELYCVVVICLIEYVINLSGCQIIACRYFFTYKYIDQSEILPRFLSSNDQSKAP